MSRKAKIVIAAVIGIVLLPVMILGTTAALYALIGFIAEGNIYTAGAILAVIFMAVQLLLCCNTQQVWIRLIPLWMIVLGFVLCVILFFGGFGEGSFAAEKILALMCALTLGIASVGVGGAWAVFGAGTLICRMKRRKNV